MRTLLTLVLFASTLIAVVLRPRGIAAGWWTCGAAPLALAAGLLGTNIGSCLTPHGSLATLLVLGAAARRGADLPPVEVVKVALWLVPPMLVAGLAGLAGLWAVGALAG